MDNRLDERILNLRSMVCGSGGRTPKAGTLARLWWDGFGEIARDVRKLQNASASTGQSVYTAEEVEQAMEVLRGRDGSTALVAEVLDDMERVLLAATDN